MKTINPNRMKKLSIYLSVAFAILTLFSSCSDDFELVKLADMDSIPPSEIVSPAQGASLELLMDNASDTLKFNWTATDYGISLAVSYQLEIAAAGTNFADPYTIYNGSETKAAITVAALNTALLNNLGLEPEVANSIEFRVLSSISTATGNLASETQTVSITPYATSFPPIYMIGAATGGWDTSLAVEVASASPNVYSTIWKFVQNETFRFFAQPDWGASSYNYPYFADGSVSSLLENAMDGDKNFRFLGTTGYYRITVNMKTLTVDMEAVSEPVMYMTGAGIGGWSQPGTGSSIKMTFVKENVWRATATFVSGEAWRFFAQADWGPTSYNFPYFASGTVASMFENAGDGDSNFKNKSGGTYVITLNLNDLSVTVAAP